MANWLTEQLLSINVVNEKFNTHEGEKVERSENKEIKGPYFRNVLMT